MIVMLTVLPIIVTKLVDLVRNAVDSNGRAPKWVWNVAAFGLGITVCLVWEVNVLAQFSHTDLQGSAGEVLTGLGLGGGASFWHEVMDFFSARAKGAPVPVINVHNGTQG